MPKIKRIFLDCGFYIGNATKMYQDKGLIDKSWTVYAFEPHPRKDTEAVLEARLPIKVQLIEKAVWTKDGEAGFLLKGREDAHHMDYDGPSEGDKQVTCETIDLSKFVDELPEAFIVCSMDIEGAEFAILEKMLADNTISKINVLDIEFHHRLMNDYTLEDSQKLIDKLILKTAVRLKEPLL